MKVQKAEKAEQRLKQKAVKQHQDFKEAVEVMRKHKMNAKRGRLLLKRHYVALIEDAGGVSDPGRISYGLLAHTHTYPRTYIYSSLRILTCTHHTYITNLHPHTTTRKAEGGHVKEPVLVPPGRVHKVYGQPGRFQR